MVYRKYKAKLWNQEEDEILRALVHKYGSRKWTLISNNFKDVTSAIRSPKQCRDRWFNNLCVEKKDSPFNDSEITTIIDCLIKLGNQWSKIAQHLPGRTENQIKNFMYATVNRNLCKFNRNKIAKEQIFFRSFKILQNGEIRSILLADKKIKASFFEKTKLSQDAFNAMNLYQCQVQRELPSLEADMKISSKSLVSKVFVTDFYEPVSQGYNESVLGNKEETYVGFLPSFSFMEDFEYRKDLVIY
ncbi:hypothetical protein SteCoe_4191 [Stentor coeruleus]|uniref:Myb-like DNA-binding domain containing protein n=1 Tax=Stentor coeruleus TaxID=5963 RepID=A0A1R2CVG5_9CILI|nr:hypothetical protein SteCoe_4191 [Stentor coeruleus]